MNEEAKPGTSIWFIDGVSLSQRAREATPLFAAHSAEVGGLGGRTPEFDIELLRELEAHGAVMNTLAFAGDRLVGYLVWYLSETTLEFKGLRMANQGPWFLAKPHRGGGVGEAMLRWSLAALRHRGYQVASPHRWERSPEALGKLFEALGAVAIERSWWLELGLAAQSKG